MTMHVTSTAAVLGAMAVLVGSSVGCGALDEFEQTFEDQLTIPAQPLNQGPVLPTFPNGQFEGLNLASARSFQNNDVSPNDVDAIYIQSIELDMESTGSSTFDALSQYIESVSFYVEAPGQSRIVIAEGSMLPASLRANLNVMSERNIKDFATASSMTIGADVQLQPSRPPPAANINVRVTMLIDINLLGT